MKPSVLWPILYALLIIGLSSVPGKSFPDLKWFSHDKLIHMVEYTILGFLVSRAMTPRVAASARIFIFTLLIAGAFGILDEVYQLLIPGRDSSYRDWVADLLGAVSGSLLFLMWKNYRDKAAAG